MTSMKSDKYQIVSTKHGFTLIEIMLVLLVLSMVVSMVSYALSGTFEVIEATQKQGEVYHRARIAMERIGEDLSMAVIHEDVNFSGGKNELAGRRADSLQFASMGHLVFDQKNGLAGMARISYDVRESSANEKEFVLIRSDRLINPQSQEDLEENSSEPDGFVLCDGLHSVEFAFYKRDGDELDEWLLEQEDESQQNKPDLPVMVRCTLNFLQNNGEDEYISFTTTVVIPTGLIRFSEEGDDAT